MNKTKTTTPPAPEKRFAVIDVQKLTVLGTHDSYQNAVDSCLPLVTPPPKTKTSKVAPLAKSKMVYICEVGEPKTPILPPLPPETNGTPASPA